MAAAVQQHEAAPQPPGGPTLQPRQRGVEQNNERGGRGGLAVELFEVAVLLGHDDVEDVVEDARG